MYITFASAKKANKAELTLALKSRGDATKIPNRGTRGPKKDMYPLKFVFKNSARGGVERRQRECKDHTTLPWSPPRPPLGNSAVIG